MFIAGDPVWWIDEKGYHSGTVAEYRPFSVMIQDDSTGVMVFPPEFRSLNPFRPIMCGNHE